ncbi:copper-sensitivity protein C [[Pantoea] beijingensis]|uniref:Copper-sensitivity protein C n=1 Tax=[Pantoea] beijingensis TaxID=1324864 RepID=A0A443I943_9GAMM|nr:MULTISPECIES: DsbA family protein [Erwiniaceae]RWR00605.1 copper-sensitivity protein C [[Pantoea] beijingensis]
MKKLMLTLLFVATPLWAAPFTPAQETRIKELIRETLVQNPDILAQAADAYNQQAEAQQKDVVSQVVEKNKQSLFDDPGSPRIGAKEARLTLVSFTDYNCPYCKQFDPLMEKLVKAHPDVAVIIKPLPYRSESSLTSARAALTLWEQNPKQWPALHQRLMAKKGYHDDASIQAAEAKVGVTLKEPSKQSLDTVNTNLKLAQQLGIQGTPATLIGSTLLPGAVPYEQLEEMVTQQLATLK